MSTWSELGDPHRSLVLNGESRWRRLIGAIVNASDPSDPASPMVRGDGRPLAGLQVTCCRAMVRRTVTAADRRLGSGVDAAEPPGGDPDQDDRVAAQHGESGPGRQGVGKTGTAAGQCSAEVGR